LSPNKTFYTNPKACAKEEHLYFYQKIKIPMLRVFIHYSVLFGKIIIPQKRMFVNSKPKKNKKIGTTLKRESV